MDKEKKEEMRKILEDLLAKSIVCMNDKDNILIRDCKNNIDVALSALEKLQPKNNGFIDFPSKIKSLYKTIERKDKKIASLERELQPKMMTEQEIANILLTYGWNWDGVSRFRCAKALSNKIQSRSVKVRCKCGEGLVFCCPDCGDVSEDLAKSHLPTLDRQGLVEKIKNYPVVKITEEDGGGIQAFEVDAEGLADAILKEEL